jgi:MFS family permease
MIGRRLALWALAIIFAANFLNYFDRQLVSALEDPLKATVAEGGLHLTEVEFGWLWSLFTIGYMVCAVPIGLLADRFRRTWLFAFCIVVWSVATIASGLAPSKHILYIARVFIGVGEAGCLVIGPGLISDYFSRRMRGRALSIFYLGLPLGGTLAFVLTGQFGQIGWRKMFWFAGAPGFVIALLVALLPEPPRGEMEEDGEPIPGHPAHSGGGSLRDYLGLLTNKTLLLVILAQTFAMVILAPLIHFGVGFFTEARHMGSKQALTTMGLMALVAGVLGNTLSGLIGDRVSKRLPGAYALLAGLAFLAGWPCLYIGFTNPDQNIFIPALTLGCFFYFFCMPAVNTQIANVVAPNQRAMAWALAVFVLHLLGDTLSPPLFGRVITILEDRYGNGGLGRQYGFVYFSIAMGVAGVCCLLAALTARKDIERLKQVA